MIVKGIKATMTDLPDTEKIVLSSSSPAPPANSPEDLARLEQIRLRAREARARKARQVTSRRWRLMLGIGLPLAAGIAALLMALTLAVGAPIPW